MPRKIKSKKTLKQKQSQKQNVIIKIDQSRKTVQRKQKEPMRQQPSQPIINLSSYQPSQQYQPIQQPLQPVSMNQSALRAPTTQQTLVQPMQDYIIDTATLQADGDLATIQSNADTITLGRTPETQNTQEIGELKASPDIQFTGFPSWETYNNKNEEGAAQYNQGSFEDNQGLFTPPQQTLTQIDRLTKADREQFITEYYAPDPDGYLKNILKTNEFNAVKKLSDQGDDQLTKSEKALIREIIKKVKTV